MAIKQYLDAAKLKDDDSKSKLDALLAYANGTTGKSDDNIGDAVKSLCDGYGGGGGGDDDLAGSIIDKSVTEVNNSTIELIGICAFYSCSSLTSVNFPAASLVRSSAFAGCSSLKYANFPAVRLIQSSAFSNCTSLISVNIPAATSIYSYAFNNCSSLTSINLPSASNIDNNAFRACANLNTITIGTSSCILGGSLAFAQTKIMSSAGSIYVPAEYVDSYKTRAGWSYFKTQIFPIGE